MAAGTLADILNKYLIGPLIDRENDMFREYVKQGQEKLEAINTIKESTKKIEKYSSRDLNYEAYKGITEVVNELKSVMFENEQVTEQLLQVWKGQDIAGVIIRSTTDIEKLLDKYASDPESREEIMREVNSATSRVQYEAFVQANAETNRDMASNIKEAYDFGITTSASGLYDTVDRRLLTLMEQSGVSYVNTETTHPTQYSDGYSW